jgi:two-component system, NarL family, response regulator NreC
MIRVVIVGHDSIILCSVQSYLVAQKDIEVLRVTKIEPDLQAILHDLQPDVVIMGMVKPDKTGVDAICDMAQKISGIGIIILVAYFNEVQVAKMLQHGIRSCLSMDTNPEELTRAIHEVSQGKRYLLNTTYRRVLECMLGELPLYNNPDPIQGTRSRLTTREHEIIDLVAIGHTCREIGEQLCISTRTVETHRANAMHKLGLSTRIELLRYAINSGVLSVE